VTLTGKQFGVAVFGQNGDTLACYAVLENTTLHGAVKSKECTWRDDPMRRVVQKQPDGKWYIMPDIHRLFHPDVKP
jgi:hypothetical protein